MTLLDNEYVTLWFHTESKIVHHQMHKFMPSAAFRETLEAGAACLEKYQACRWLSDDRGNTAAVRQADAEWADGVWAPRVIRAGFKYWAVVMPAQAIGQMQMRKFIADYKARGVEVEAFDAPEAARAWLESVGAPAP
jgi:hypothetical protein